MILRDIVYREAFPQACRLNLYLPKTNIPFYIFTAAVLRQAAKTALRKTFSVRL